MRLLEVEDIRIVFDATGAGPHMIHAPGLKAAGKIAIDLTPAAVGPYVVPSVNFNEEIFKLDNVNMVTCAGQATLAHRLRGQPRRRRLLRRGRLLDLLQERGAGHAAEP